MGLDLYCADFHTRFGSYSTVHAVRKDWINAFTKVLQEYISTYKPLSSTDEEISLQVEYAETLLPLLLEHTAKINYSTFKKIDSPFDGFQGLKNMVDHSDCEDTWTSFEAESILLTLSMIKDHLNKADFYGSTYYLEPILTHSVQIGKHIYFA
jgi:hypothetical protein